LGSRHGTGYDAWHNGDLGAVLDLLHTEVEWEENAQVFPGLDRVYLGHEGFLKRVRDAFEAWESFTVYAIEFIDAANQVVIPLRLSAKGRQSGIPVEMTVCEIFSFRDGRVVRRHLYADRAEALKAVGLEE